MRKKTIDIPIYGVKLTMVFDEDFSYVEKKYNLEPIKGRAVTIFDGNNERHVIAAFINKEFISSITHEVVHIKNFIFLKCGAKLDRDNDECEAYLSGYLFEQIYNFINK